MPARTPGSTGRRRGSEHEPSRPGTRAWSRNGPSTGSSCRTPRPLARRRRHWPRRPRPRKRRYRRVSGSVCQIWACTDYRLILLTPSLGQPLFADRGDVGPAAAPTSQGDSKDPDQAGDDSQQDHDVCVRAHSRLSIATLVPLRSVVETRVSAVCPRPDVAEPQSVEATLQELRGRELSVLTPNSQFPTPKPPTLNVGNSRLGSWKLEVSPYGTTAIGACQNATLRPFGSSTLT